LKNFDSRRLFLYRTDSYRDVITTTNIVGSKSRAQTWLQPGGRRLDQALNGTTECVAAKDQKFQWLKDTFSFSGAISEHCVGVPCHRHRWSARFFCPATGLHSSGDKNSSNVAEVTIVVKLCSQPRHRRLGMCTFVDRPHVTQVAQCVPTPVAANDTKSAGNNTERDCW
jgi:hypothetical protein